MDTDKKLFKLNAISDGRCFLKLNSLSDSTRHPFLTNTNTFQKYFSSKRVCLFRFLLYLSYAATKWKSLAQKRGCYFFDREHRLRAVLSVFSLTARIALCRMLRAPSTILGPW